PAPLQVELPKIVPTPSANPLFTEQDAKRIAALAQSKQLPVPDFQIDAIARNIPESFRRFVGVWVSDKGWTISTRQFMLIVTTVDINGGAAGYVVNGPAKPKSPVQGPGYSYSFKGRVLTGSLVYATANGYVGSLTI